MSKIYEFTPLYSMVKRYITFTFKRFYSEFIIIGKENIPTDGPIIYAPNHTNALMDALAILASVPHQQSVVYLARADIFKNKIAARFLRFTKIMPAFRMRDGFENLSKNDQTFDKCIEVLEKNHALGIMPEGDQGEQRKLRPFRKGIFRIAFSAQQKYGLEKGVRIVPVGIHLEDFIKFGKPIIVSFGKPIEVSDYMPVYTENHVQAMNEIRAKLRSDLNDLTLNLETHEYYQCFESIIEIAEQAKLKQLKLDHSIVSRFIAKRKIAEELKLIEKNNPKKIEKLKLRNEELSAGLEKFKLNTNNFDQNNSNQFSLFIELFYLLSTSILFILGFLLNFLPFYIPYFASRNVIKVKYSGFISSVHYVIGIITFPVFYTLQTLFLSSVLCLPTWSLLFVFIGHYILGKFAFNWYNQASKLFKRIHFSKMKRKYPEEFKSLNSIRELIIDELVKK